MGTKEKLIFNSKLCVIAQGEDNANMWCTEMAVMDLHCFFSTVWLMNDKIKEG